MSSRHQLKQSAAFASSTFVTMGLVDLFGHWGPTGLLIAGLASYVAWNHGPEVLENIAGQVREILPPSEEQADEEQIETSDDEQPRRRSFWERALNAPLSDGELAALEEQFEADDDDPEVFISEGMTFQELLELGVIQEAISAGKMVLGFANGELRYGTWKDFNSAGIGGVSGSGKTTTIRFLLFQTVLLKGRFIMIDPHIEDQEESLAAQFRVFKQSHVFPPCDDNASAVTKRVRWLMKEYLRRKEQGIKGPPIILVLDELNALIRRMSPELRKELTDLLLTLAQEGRKFGLFALLIAQRWSEQDQGGKPYGAAIRSSLSSMLAHRFIDEEQAKKLIGSKNGPRCLELEKGHYLFRDTEGHLAEIVTPFTQREDSQAVLRLVRQREPEEIVQPSTETGDQKHEKLEQKRPLSGVIRSPYYDQTIYGDGNQNGSVENQNRHVNLGVNTSVNGSESHERPDEEEGDFHLPFTPVNGKNGGVDTHRGSVNVNVNGTQGISAEKRETIKRLHEMGLLTHAQIAKAVKLDGRNYHIYKQVCAEEGIEIK
jgi:hypothetical protein